MPAGADTEAVAVSGVRSRRVNRNPNGVVDMICAIPFSRRNVCVEHLPVSPHRKVCPPAPIEEKVLAGPRRDRRNQVATKKQAGSQRMGARRDCHRRLWSDSVRQCRRRPLPRTVPVDDLRGRCGAPRRNRHGDHVTLRPWTVGPPAHGAAQLQAAIVFASTVPIEVLWTSTAWTSA